METRSKSTRQTALFGFLFSLFVPSVSLLLVSCCAVDSKTAAVPQGAQSTSLDYSGLQLPAGMWAFVLFDISLAIASIDR